MERLMPQTPATQAAVRSILSRGGSGGDPAVGGGGLKLPVALGGEEHRLEQVRFYLYA